MAAVDAHLLRGVHPGWNDFLAERGLLDPLHAALAKVGDDLSPPEHLVFEYLRFFGPDDARVVIIGQDPYPTEAQGVCFSIPPDQPLKQSLKPIIANLERHGLARAHYRHKDNPQSGQVYCGDLRSWATQGVLLMNAALTTRAGVIGSHRGVWKAFTAAFLRALADNANERGRPLIALLWGDDARAHAQGLSQRGATVYQWTHPSPARNNTLPPVSRFENAPHFADANQTLIKANERPIEWDPLALTLAFTDGSCPRNGKPDAVASYAAYVLMGPLRKVQVRGLVSPHAYAFVDEDSPLRGFAPVEGTPMTPTNNRGEYLAWCWVLLTLLRGGVRGRVEVVSDCNLFIQTMKSWLPARRRKGTEKELSNFDLVHIADVLLGALREGISVGGVEMTHVNSHRKIPENDGTAAGIRARVLWYGNDHVDRAAGELTAHDRVGASSASSAIGYEPEFTTGSPALDWCLNKRYA